MNVIRYETNPKDFNKFYKKSIFLAGPTVRDEQTWLPQSWRFDAIKEFEAQGFDGNLFVPEFEFGSKAVTYSCPEWEYEALSNVNVIMFWVPRTQDLIGLTTNCEFGYWMVKRPDDIVYGRPDDAYRIYYLDFLWDKHFLNNPIHKTLKETIKFSISKI